MDKCKYAALSVADVLFQHDNNPAQAGVCLIVCRQNELEGNMNTAIAGKHLAATLSRASKSSR